MGGEDFKRSRRFGVIGVVVVAVATAAIGLTLGSGSERPTAALVAILALVFGYVAVLLVLQRRDAEAARARARREAVAAAGDVADPTRADRATLLAALAVRPGDEQAIARAQERSWGTVLGSIDSAVVMVALIFVAVVPWVLLGFAWSLVVLVPVIAGYAIYLSLRAVGPGGTLDRGYDDAAVTLEPLGLRLVERPRVSAAPRPVGPGLQKRISGAVAYEGERHGRPVSVRLEGGAATTSVGGPVRAFEVAAAERLRAAPGAPDAVAKALEGLRASSWWRGVSATGGGGGVVVERRRGGAEHWLRDLWLAERLADAASR